MYELLYTATDDSTRTAVTASFPNAVHERVVSALDKESGEGVSLMWNGIALRWEQQ